MLASDPPPISGKMKNTSETLPNHRYSQPPKKKHLGAFLARESLVKKKEHMPDDSM